jgi:hypothetical protein
MTSYRWYSIGRTVYAQRGDHADTRDPVAALCASEAIALHVVSIHNAAVGAARHHIPSARSTP